MAWRLGAQFSTVGQKVSSPLLFAFCFTIETGEKPHALSLCNVYLVGLRLQHTTHARTGRWYSSLHA